MKWWKGSKEIFHIFHRIDTVGDIDNATMFPTEFLNSQHLSGLPEHKLKLKNNSVVIFAAEYGHLWWPLQWNKIFGQSDWTVQGDPA